MSYEYMGNVVAAVVIALVIVEMTHRGQLRAELPKLLQLCFALLALAWPAYGTIALLGMHKLHQLMIGSVS